MKLEIRDFRNRNKETHYGRPVTVEFDINWLKGILAAFLFSGGEPTYWEIGGYSLQILSYECRGEVIWVKVLLDGDNRYINFNHSNDYAFLPIFEPRNRENND